MGRCVVSTLYKGEWYEESHPTDLEGKGPTYPTHFTTVNS